MAQESGDNRGPFLSAALFCERVIEDKEGVLSAIRIVDRLFFQIPNLPSGVSRPPLPVNLTMLVTFKAGVARGRSSVKIRSEAPSGLKGSEIAFPVLFEGEDRGVNLILNMGLLAEEEGLYWFDVLLDDQPVTRVPLRVVFHQVETGPAKTQ